jgi:hypothetical protein
MSLASVWPKVSQPFLSLVILNRIMKSTFDFENMGMLGIEGSVGHNWAAHRFFGFVGHPMCLRGPLSSYIIL